LKLKKSNKDFDRKSLYKESFEIKSEIENSGFIRNLSEIYKKIGESYNSDYDKKYTKYLSLYMTLQTMYKSFHWLTSGTAYYSDHKLFEDLYSSVNEEIDVLAEKLVGLFGKDCVNPIISSKIVFENLSKLLDGFSANCDPHDLVAIALYFEIIFLELNNEFYKDVSENGVTLGLDDLIMSNHNSHEQNLYHLKSRFSSQVINRDVDTKDIMKSAEGEAPLYKYKKGGKVYYYTPAQMIAKGIKDIPKGSSPASLSEIIQRT